MSQPAMSGALARLRKHFDDELLVRIGRGFELSPLAERLRPAVEEAVEAAEALLGNQREFDPTSSTRRFTVSMSEYAMTVLAEPLTRLLAEQAPGCSVALDAVDVAPEQFESQLMRRDLIIGAARLRLPRPPPAGLHRPPRLRGRPRQPAAARRRADPRRPAGDAARRRGVRGGRRAQRRPLEVELERAGIVDRPVLVQVTSLLTLPFAVSGTEMCAFVPARLAHRCLDILDLVIADDPARRRADHRGRALAPAPRRPSPPCVWLRRLLYDVAVVRGGRRQTPIG